jgi:hypothetical protein
MVDMTYHETFWIAIATAAPIIALANTILIADIISAKLNSMTRKKDWPGEVRFLSFIVYAGSGLNLLIQAEAMYSAFRHLLVGKDRINPSLTDPFEVTSPSGIAFIVFLGLICVLITAVNDGIFKYRLHDYEEREKRESAQGASPVPLLNSTETSGAPELAARSDQGRRLRRPLWRRNL